MKRFNKIKITPPKLYKNIYNIEKSIFPFFIIDKT
jgi:hypothetical protein